MTHEEGNGPHIPRAFQAPFRATFERAPIGIAHVSPSGQWLNVNQALADIVGYSREEFTELTFQDITHPDDLHADLELFNQVLAGDIDSYTMEKRYIRKDGSYVWIELSVSLVRDADNVPAFFISIIEDISEKKSLERSLALRTEVVELCLASPDDALFDELLSFVLRLTSSEYGVVGYVDHKGDLVVPSMTKHVWDQCRVANKRVVFPRESWSDTSSWPRALREMKPNYTNEPSVDIPEGHIAITRHISVPVLHGGRSVGLFQVANKPTDYSTDDINELLIVAQHLAPLLVARMQTAARTRALEAAKDEVRIINETLEERVAQRTQELETASAELETLNDELTESTQAKSRFLAGMSHELRTPLNSILGFSGVLLQELPGELNDEQRVQLEMIRNSGTHLLALINDILDLSRIEAGGVDLECTTFPVGEVVSEVVGMLATAAAEKGLALGGPDVEGCTLVVHTDRRKLEQIMLNLVSNAVKFTEAGAVVVSLECDDDLTRIFISDTGPGIAPQQLERIFDEYRQVGVREHGRPVGTGLGLSISRAFARLLGGDITVESTLGEGSVFTLEIPIEIPADCANA